MKRPIPPLLALALMYLAGLATVLVLAWKWVRSLFRRE